MSKKEDENALISFRKSLGDDDDVTIRVFQRQEAEWACLGKDAETVAQIVYRTASALRKFGSAQVPMCSMNSTLFRSFLTEALQKRGLRVEIYEQESGSRTRWRSTPRQASPGNLQAVEDLIGAAVDQRPVTVAVKVSNAGATAGDKRVGVCFIDAEAQRLGLSEFVDNELFSNLESLLIQLGAKEVLAADDSSADTKRIIEMMERLDVLTTRRKPAQFSSKDVDQDLERLTGRTSLELQRELQMEVALGAAGAALKFLGLMAMSSNFGNFQVEEHDLHQYMRLDASALKALNVMPSVRDATKTMSLFGLLNQCKTTAGARLLAQWLKQPLMSVEDINERQDLVAEFIENSILRTHIQDDLLLAVPDLAKIERKFHAQKVKLEDVVRVYHLAIRLPEFVEELGATEPLSKAYAAPLSHAASELAKLIELVETTIDLAALERHEYVVKADFDEHLVDLKKRRQAAYEEMELELERVGAELNTDKVKLEDNPTLGWAFRLTRTDASCLRGKTGFIDLKTQKAGQFFTTKKLRTLASEQQALGEEYNRTQSSVAREVVNIASTYMPVFGPLGATLAHLDVILSFAQVSAFAKLPYVRPTFGDQIVLKQARHPCIEAQTDMMFIPNDVDLQHDKSEFAIITGPNMGGKSTYIRQTGVIAHMAQIGCFVPCEEAQLTIIDCILARVGAGDSQLKGISTFMAEMLETASILKTATPRSLIIIDELGRGTSTYDGFGLAWAISQHIVEHIGCWCLFATHFHELTALADRYPGVTNLHVVANADETEDDITLLYKVEPGVSAQSFGIHVAEVVHFPLKVVRMAKRKAEELERLDGDGDVSAEDVKVGTAMLQETLKQWAQGCVQSEDRDASIKRLRSEIAAKQTQFEANPFLKQVLSSL